MALPPTPANAEEDMEGLTSGCRLASPRSAPLAAGRPAPRLPRRWALALACALCAAAALGFAAGGPLARRRAVARRGDVGASVNLGLAGDAFSAAASLATGVTSTAELMGTVEEDYKGLKAIFGLMKNSTRSLRREGERLERQMRLKEHLLAKLHTMNATQKAEVRTRLMKDLNISSFRHLRPRMRRHDGNVCEDDEELHLRLCYKKCSLLTNGELPLRQSAWTCCAQEPCGIYNTKTEMSVCGGFGVAGDATGGDSCPHAPGACLQDEEMLLGTCYKRCSLLTYGQLPHRLGGATCCRIRSRLGFLDLANCDTEDEYGVGGGQQEGAGPQFPSHVHAPLAELTEVGGSVEPDNKANAHST